MNRLTNNEPRRLVSRCSRLWRLNNLYTVTDRCGRRVVFTMNSAQEALYHAMHLIRSSKSPHLVSDWCHL
jgi:hypothetical protein